MSIGIATLADLLSYVAGFLDGEGHFSIRGNRVEIMVDGIHPAPLLRCQDLFGGSLNDAGQRGNYRRRFRWRVCGETARCACKLLIEGSPPYLSNKLPEAEAIAYSKDYPEGTHTGDWLRRRALQSRAAEYNGVAT